MWACMPWNPARVLVCPAIVCHKKFAIGNWPTFDWVCHRSKVIICLCGCDVHVKSPATRHLLSGARFRTRGIVSYKSPQTIALRLLADTNLTPTRSTRLGTFLSSCGDCTRGIVLIRFVSNNCRSLGFVPIVVVLYRPIVWPHKQLPEHLANCGPIQTIARVRNLRKKVPVRVHACS